MPKIPRDPANDYTAEAVRSRREFLEQQTGADLEHVSSGSLDPEVARGNIENLTGVAQIPLGFAGPLLVDGEHAQGEFYVPLATSEGTLVASYNRGMRLTREAGGVRVTVTDDAMQRAPVFVFPDARAARDFGIWVTEHFDEIKAVAEATTSVGKLRDIEQYCAARLRFLRFNYTTGDAAGQNMTGKATYVACRWIVNEYPGIERWLLSGNMDTDKKSSHLNTLHTRGKRVTAEITIPDELMQKVMHVSTRELARQRTLAQVGTLLAGATNNGAHSPNGIAAVFLATGQDAGNIAESSVAIAHAELNEDGSYYYSVTIPSLIVATYGGGTGLPTQRECLEVMDCYGAGKVKKLAEIVGATVLCGELSLGSAIVAEHWVSSHERLGRNR